MVKTLVPGRQNYRPIRRISGSLWPDGTFGYGATPESHDETQGYFYEGRWVERTEVTDPYTLGLSNVTNSHIVQSDSVRVRRGLRGITGLGRRSVRSACSVLEREFGKRQLGFLTLTLPRMERGSLSSIAESWGTVTNRLMQWVRRSQRRSGLRELAVMVTELQPGRAASGDIGALHLHVCFVGRGRGSTWCFTPRQVRKAWLNILRNASGDATISSESCENLVMVRKSAARYMSKYMTKGAGQIGEWVESVGERHCPKSWWSLTAAMREMLRSRIRRGYATAEVLQDLVNSWVMSSVPDGCSIYRVEIDSGDGQKTHVGWAGVLSRKYYERVLRSIDFGEV